MSSSNQQLGVLCSGCATVLPASQVATLPLWNDTLSAFVTTYRCSRCLPSSVEETKQRLQNAQKPEETDQVVQFLMARGIFILEYQRGDPPEVIQRILLAVLDKIGEGTLRIPPQTQRWPVETS